MYSAASLFTTLDDVRFRLVQTYIVYRNKIYRVIDAEGGYQADRVSIIVQGLDGLTREFLLAELPVSAMFDCPSGYLGDTWYARAPTRTYRQGIIREALTGRHRHSVSPLYLPGGTQLGRTLDNLLAQPKIAASNKNHRTRDVLILPDHTVLVRGRPAGSLPEGTKTRVKTLYPCSRFERQLLLNANLEPFI